MSPSSPAFFSSFAKAVICWSAASTSSGGSSQPISAALPESWIHRSTRASLAAFCRRCLAFSGAAFTTARAIAARSAPGVRRAARSRTSCSAARASSGSRNAVARAMISALYREIVPSSSAAAVPGQMGFQGLGQADQALRAVAGLPQRAGHLVGGELLSGGAGLRRASSATAASLRARAWVSTRSQAHTTPISSASDTPANRSSSPAAASAATARPAQPGSTSRAIPGPNAAAGLDDSPGKARAEPG